MNELLTPLIMDSYIPYYFTIHVFKYADMNELLTQLIMESCINLILTGERLVMEHVMLLAILNTNIGNEVGKVYLCGHNK